MLSTEAEGRAQHRETVVSTWQRSVKTTYLQKWIKRGKTSDLVRKDDTVAFLHSCQSVCKSRMPQYKWLECVLWLFLVLLAERIFSGFSRFSLPSKRKLQKRQINVGIFYDCILYTNSQVQAFQCLDGGLMSSIRATGEQSRPESS